MVIRGTVGVIVRPELHISPLGLVHDLDVEYVHEQNVVSPSVSALEEPCLDRCLHHQVSASLQYNLQLIFEFWWQHAT